MFFFLFLVLDRFELNPHLIQEVDKYLTQFPDLVNAQNGSGNTALMLFSQQPNLVPVPTYSVQTHLVQTSKNVTPTPLQELGKVIVSGADGSIPDTYLCKEFLAKHNFNINVQNAKGETALMLAEPYKLEVMLKNENLVRNLDINIQNNANQTLLHVVLNNMKSPNHNTARLSTEIAIYILERYHSTIDFNTIKQDILTLADGTYMYELIEGYANNHIN